MSANKGMETKTLNADEFFNALIAALRVTGSNDLLGTQPRLHRAFREVMKQLNSSPELSDLKVNLLNVDFDPLYGLSGWFDRALTRAQRDLLISFPNPSYDVVKISIEQEEGEEVLSRSGHKDAFLKLANVFQKSLAGAGKRISSE